MKKILFLVLIGLAGGLLGTAVPLDAGENVDKADADKLTREFTANEIKAAITSYVEKKQKEGKGIFPMIDRDDANKQLKLKFVKIHDPVRQIESKGLYFACSDFQVISAPDQLYDLDFWLKPEGDALVVTEERVHKDPQQEGGKWVKKERYTFNQKDEIVWLRKPISQEAN